MSPAIGDTCLWCNTSFLFILFVRSQNDLGMNMQPSLTTQICNESAPACNLPSRRVIASARSVTKRFNGKTALHDINLDICSGQVLAILGANGAGKTCLLYTSDAADE